jgi:FMN reductase [NAD(P)H]
MDFADILRRRKMVRNYTDEAVHLEAIERIVACGRRAPSGGFSQGVRMVVVTEPETRTRIAELADEPYYLERGYEPWISRAPVHIVVAMREGDYHDRYREPDKLEDGEEIEWRVPWWWVDAGKAIMLLLLAAVDEGLGAGLFGLVGDQNDRLRELLGMPEDLEIVGVVTIGHPAPEPMEERRRETLRKRRRPLEEVIRWERW